MERAESGETQLHAVYCTHNASAIILELRILISGPNAIQPRKYPRQQKGDATNCFIGPLLNDLGILNACLAELQSRRMARLPLGHKGPCD
jgi:hypothetical protein